ncbi:hypothetical protein [Demequina sediminis]|uniref:hypothetical protein n=1 Tax=Demequina sediminis TaxID=1930058 RepID=UPI003305B1B7
MWTYTTVMADVIAEFDPVAADAESIALAWVPTDEVSGLALHPGFAAAWPALREALGVRPVIVVDVANVVGAVPDGWWQDRAGAALRHLERLANLAASPVPAGALSLPLHGWFPRIVAVIEGTPATSPPRPRSTCAARRAVATTPWPRWRASSPARDTRSRW